MLSCFAWQPAPPQSAVSVVAPVDASSSIEAGSTAHSWAWHTSSGLGKRALSKCFEKASLCLGLSLALRGIQSYIDSGFEVLGILSIQNWQSSKMQ